MMHASFALTFGAVTLRAQMAVAMAGFHLTYGQISPWLAWTSWIPNLLAVVLYELATRTPRARAVRAVVLT